jgi:hypothetical protein
MHPGPHSLTPHPKVYYRFHLTYCIIARVEGELDPTTATLMSF